MAPPHPLRRISTGSLSSLARSTDRAPSSNTNVSGLDFLQPALTDLVDEASTLASNISQMTALHDALGTFNEAFAGYLYALKMNAFCVEWPQAPNEVSFQRLDSLAGVDPSVPTTSNPIPPTPPSHSHSSRPSIHAADLTYATTYSNSIDDVPRPTLAKKGRPAPPTAAGAAGKKPATAASAAAVAQKRAAALAQKKKRELEVSGIIDTLPLEYRGGEPAERMRMEKVIMKLMDNPTGIPLKEMVSPPEMPQAKVNKCLITLVAKKLVAKPTIDKVTMYKWVGA